MAFDTLLALAGLAFVASWTPGPNNLMLAGSGANFGFWRTAPHALGVALGFPVMMFAVAFGLGALVAGSPALREAMRWGGAALLLWFAWRIATAGAAEGKAAAKPLTLLEAAGFQWINPKGWAMALATSAQFVTGAAPVRESAICAAVYLVSGLGSSATWAGFGVGIGRLLSTPARLRVFNIGMGLAVASFVVLLLRQ